MNPDVMLLNFTIGPLKLLFEVIFSLSNRVLNVGMSIVALSLAINILVLPLYRRADAIQEEERQTEARLNPGIKHIRKAFHGDEQFMMLQTYYRQNHYSPVHALKGIIPLMLEIPFFIAAYQFLSRLGSLQGASLGPIQDLSAPDRLLQIGGLSFNLLPILMTAINLFSSLIYTKGAPIRTKIQLLGMALIFLVLLYDSPAGLTFYWTLNNLFSLVKNLLQRIFPKKDRPARRIPKLLQGSPRPKFFFLCALLLAILTGLLIPSAVLSASPEDFITFIAEPHPVWYAIHTFLIAAGFFILWAGVYYALGSAPMKRGMELGFWVLFGVFLINYLFFRNNLGTVSSILIYERTPEFSSAQKLINLGILILAAAVLLILLTRKENLARGLAWAMALTMLGMSGRNLWTVRQKISVVYETQSRNYSGAAEIPLSRDGKNVVVIMLDRAINSYIPCILYERPELRDVYSGFTYYPNTLSYGSHTNFASPALFGGYDYTPRNINARSSVSLKDKQNEALMLMPSLFSQEGFQVTAFDMPYPGNYTGQGDYTLYDSLPDTNARKLIGSEETKGQWGRMEDIRLRNFFCYSMSMVVPTALYGTVYNMGYYNRAQGAATLFSMTGEVSDSSFSIQKRDMDFLLVYEVLDSLKKMTVIQEGNRGTLFLLANDTTHEATLLPEPEYAPVREPDNSAYDEAHADRFLAGPIPLSATTEYQMAHYEINMAALLSLGDWLTWLKESGVYDNTRIIVVSDHGWILAQIQQGILDAGDEAWEYNPLGTREDVMEFNPLLLVKDFGATGEIQTDTSFMTNADVPTLAMKDLISNPVNPFTGNPVNSDPREETQYVIVSHLSDVGSDSGTTFAPAPWFAVTPGGETLFDPARWTFLPEKQ